MTVEAAYREVGPKIVGYLVATGTDEATARDLLHDAFARIVARGERPGDDLCALAFVMARNLRANLLRDGSRLSVVERPEDLDERTTDGLRETAAADVAYLRARLTAALGELFDAADGTPPAAPADCALLQQLRLVHNGRPIAFGHLDRLGDQPAFIVESPTT